MVVSKVQMMQDEGEDEEVRGGDMVGCVVVLEVMGYGWKD